MDYKDYLVSFKDDGTVSILAVNFLTRETYTIDEDAFLRRLNLYKGYVPKGAPPAFIVSDRRGRHSIPIDQVFYLKSEHKYTSIRTVNGTYLLESSLVEMEERLALAGFLRVNRNALVNMALVRGIEFQYSASGTPSSVIVFHHIPDEVQISRRSVGPVNDAFRTRGVCDFHRRSAFVR